MSPISHFLFDSMYLMFPIDSMSFNGKQKGFTGACKTNGKVFLT